jgi:hypothetical protein
MQNRTNNRYVIYLLNRGGVYRKGEILSHEFVFRILKLILVHLILVVIVEFFFKGKPSSNETSIHITISMFQ